MKPRASKLAVEIDGAELDDEAAREIWLRFSEFCETGTPEAFAASEEVQSVTPTVKKGVPTLLVVTRVPKA
jgi:hypothetical protein